MTKEELDKFTKLCDASGGTTKDGACVCKEELCDVGAVCNLITGICGNQSKPTDISSSDSKSSSTSTALSFADLCKASGGTAKDGICVCKETSCDEGVLCNTKSKECANKDAVELECNDSYTNSCSNSLLGIGIIKECQKGIIVNRSCGTVSCNEEGTDCGECLDDIQTCTEDKNFHATVTRCKNGKKVTESCGENSCDPLDKDYYKCPVACREGTDPQKMENECDINQCSDCNPCWGEEMKGAPSNPNPCYDEERCKKILADEDPDYPPFRDFETKNKWKDLIPSKKMAAKTVHGYNWNNHKPVSSPEERVEDFEFDLTNETRHVTCNALGTYFGKCHNSLQTCINKDYHTGGFMVVCSNGELVDDDGNGDGIACNCEITANNSNGCCYTRSTCFKQTNWATNRCAKPTKNETDD